MDPPDPVVATERWEQLVLLVLLVCPDLQVPLVPASMSHRSTTRRRDLTPCEEEEDTTTALTSLT